nr:hypothetical protein [Tanacetum cinerariifolium]
MKTLTSMCEMVCQNFQKKQEEKRIEEEQAAKARYWKIPAYEVITPEGIPNTMCDVHLVNNPTPLEAKDHFEIIMNSNDDISSYDDDSLYNENIEYVEASPYDSVLVSLEAAEIVIPKVEEIEKFDFEGKSILIKFRFSVGLQTPDDLSQSRLGLIEKMGVHG